MNAIETENPYRNLFPLPRAVSLSPGNHKMPSTFALEGNPITELLLLEKNVIRDYIEKSRPFTTSGYSTKR